MKHWTDLAMNLSPADIKLIHYIRNYAKKEGDIVIIDTNEFLELYGLKIAHSYFLARKSLIKRGVIWATPELKRTNKYFYDKKIC